MTTIITARGCGEVAGSPDNMTAYLYARLDQAKFTLGEDIPYPASVGPANAEGDPLGPSLEESLTEGLALLEAAIEAADEPVALAGYSEGALLVSRFLETYRGDQVAWVALVANPARATGESIDPGPVGYGIEGAHAPWPNVPVFTAANPQDGITSCPPDSPLRDLAAGLDGLTFATLSWTAALAERLLVGQWPTADFSVEQLAEAGRLMYGYLLGGQHTTAYVSGGYLDRLADRINTA